MIIETPKPNDALKDIAKEYYFIALNSTETQKQIPIVDDCCHDFVTFKEADALFRYGQEKKTLEIAHKVFTILNLKPPYQLSFKDSLTFFTIKLQPWMNNCFFSTVADTAIVNLEDYNDKLLLLQQQLVQGESLAECVLTADDFLLSKRVRLTPTIEFVKQVCEFVYEQKGIIKVNEISEHFNKSRQYINKVFRQEVMCSLKKFIVAARILDLIKYRSKHKNSSLTALSYDYGYFDQSHFINDFKRICGVTPTYYFDHLPEFILRHN